ncbi:hypothetical protein SK128_018209, partial [Halocaridina rubra]
VQDIFAMRKIPILFFEPCPETWLESIESQTPIGARWTEKGRMEVAILYSFGGVKQHIIYLKKVSTNWHQFRIAFLAKHPQGVKKYMISIFLRSMPPEFVEHQWDTKDPLLVLNRASRWFVRQRVKKEEINMIVMVVLTILHVAAHRIRDESATIVGEQDILSVIVISTPFCLTPSSTPVTVGVIQCNKRAKKEALKRRIGYRSDSCGEMEC